MTLGLSRTLGDQAAGVDQFYSSYFTGFEINFMKSWTSNMLVNYDYSSVLHYGR